MNTTMTFKGDGQIHFWGKTLKIPTKNWCRQENGEISGFDYDKDGSIAIKMQKKPVELEHPICCSKQNNLDLENVF